jgi:hypothetical protein
MRIVTRTSVDTAVRMLPAGLDHAAARGTWIRPLPGEAARA